MTVIAYKDRQELDRDVDLYLLIFDSYICITCLKTN